MSYRHLIAAALIPMMSFLTPLTGHGESSAFRTNVSGAEAPLTTLLQQERERARSNRGIAISLRRIQTRVRRIGRIHIDLTQLRTRTWEATLGKQNDPLDVALLKGRASIRRGTHRVTVPIAGAVFKRNGIETLQLNLIASTRMGRGRGVEITLPLVKNQPARVTTAPTSLLQSKRCATALDSAPTHSLRSGGGAARMASVTLRELGLATVADPLWVTRYGATSNATIAALINSASTIYERDLGLTLTILDQRSATIAAPTDPSNAEQWLDQFQAYAASNLTASSFDVKYLFTTRTFAQSVIGIAFLGVVCDTPALSVGLIRDVSASINFLTFAHELGHNLNADHDPDSNASPCTPAVMCPFIASTHTSFSTLSRNAITAHVSTTGSCLASTAVTPTPGPSPTPIIPSTPTPSADDPGSGELPSIGLSSTLTTGGRFTLRITVAGDEPPGTRYTLALSDNSTFREPAVRNLQFVPSGPGTYLVAERLNNGVRKRYTRSTRRLIRQRIYLRLEARHAGATVAKQISVDPTRVRRSPISLRSWLKLLTRTIARN